MMSERLSPTATVLAEIANIERLKAENAALLAKEDSFHAEIEKLHSEIAKSEKEKAMLVEALKEAEHFIVSVNPPKYVINLVRTTLSRIENEEADK